MKLIICKKCSDIFRLRFEKRTCTCGLSGGQYINNLDAEIWGEHAIPLGFASSSFVKALRKDISGKQWGEKFDAFVIPMPCPTIRRIDCSD